MTYKTVLVHAEAYAEAAPRLQTAAAVARKFEAMLIGLGGQMLDWGAMGDPYGVTSAEVVDVLVNQVELDTAAAKKLFEAQAGSAPHVWMTAAAAPAEAMACLARGADLIVAGGAAPGSDDGFNRTARPVDLILQSGRPVLVAPPSGGEVQGKQIVVAWKDTREARRAVADALPFLERADEVTVLEICDADSIDAARARTADVALYLKRHGVTARSQAKISPPGRAAFELDALAENRRADLIVSGAYGHARLQEWVLGGVTRDLLANTQRFVLLSH